MDLAGRHYNTGPLARKLEELAKRLPSLDGVAPPLPERAAGPRRVKPLSEEQVQAIVEGYGAGATVYDLASRFGIDRKRVSRILKREGVEMRGAGLTAAQAAEAVRLHESGRTQEEIAKALGVSRRTVQRKLQVG